MKFTEIDHQKLSKVLFQATLTAIQQQHKTVKHAMLDFESSTKNTLEDEFIKDLFYLTTDEIADKWFGGKDNIGFYIKK